MSDIIVIRKLYFVQLQGRRQTNYPEITLRQRREHLQWTKESTSICFLINISGFIQSMGI